MAGPAAFETGVPGDFRQMMPIGARLHSPFQQMVYARGYDHNFVLNTCQGWRGKETNLRLMGWSRQRWVVLLRRPFNRSLGLVDRTKHWSGQRSNVAGADLLRPGLSVPL